MAHINARSHWLNQGTTLWNTPLLICLWLLPYPYFMVVGLLGFLLVAVWQTYLTPKALLKLLHRYGFGVLSGLLVISAGFAAYPGEAFLQLTHFIPFFWVWAALVLYLQQTPNPWQQISRWALILVLSAVPLNLIAIFEYALKYTVPLQELTHFPWIDWLYVGDIHHPRTFSLFDWPNTLANYLVMVLGLNIGLLFLRRGTTVSLNLPWPCRVILPLNVPLTLIALFCSGSRNGYAAALVLLLVSMVGVRAQRWVRGLALLSLTIIVVTTLQFGMAGRSLSWTWITDDPRNQVWRLALQMIRDRPWLGQGLGNYKLLYNGEIPDYDFVAHAHNLWLMLASEAGIPVMVGFTIAIGAICYRGLKGLRTLRQSPEPYAVLLAYTLCFFSTTLFSVLDVAIFEARVNMLGWLSLAVLYCGPELSQKVQKPPLD